MTVLIVHESMFGNTQAIAEAIAEGMTKELPCGDDPAGGPVVRVVPVTAAPTEIPDDVSLLLVGAPTHAFSMSRERTRQDAVRQGAAGEAAIGVREWIDRVVPRSELPVVTFDTRVHVRLLPGSAAKTSANALRHRGFHRAERGESFWVGGVAGPLSHDEVVRARAWGVALAGQHLSPAPAS
ncbi:MAG: flavodoxin/nitric oxide synthase [Intrasporangium sp.]|uniref:flavodoxin family protein n=1 Tax=Intrasporangium sp. TaxID=1925024 RepID=UPI0026489A7C|nr:flavodoxin/nitric oxide synthase [Intrasporangium sp.]MDN5796525.1 flavodoxin/nitric oxide synthase [Intrasporangium sp.]